MVSDKAVLLPIHILKMIKVMIMQERKHIVYVMWCGYMCLIFFPFPSVAYFVTFPGCMLNALSNLFFFLSEVLNYNILGIV